MKNAAFIYHAGTGTLLNVREVELLIVPEDQLKAFQDHVDAEDMEGAELRVAVRGKLVDDEWGKNLL